MDDFEDVRIEDVELCHTQTFYFVELCHNQIFKLFVFLFASPIFTCNQCLCIYARFNTF